MATQNAINIPLPIAVSNGGTGATTLTDHGILVGSGTAAIDALSVGGTGTLLAGSTGSNPVFTSSIDGDFTFTSTTAGTNRILTVSNTDNTDSGSSATLQLTTGGSSGGDPALRCYVEGIRLFLIGIDSSDAAKLKIGKSASLDFNNMRVMTTDGERTMPLQPAASSYLSVSTLNITGDGTVATIPFNVEIFDQNSDFASNTWTAPVTGIYLILCSIDVQNSLTTGATIFGASIVTSNRTYTLHAGPGRKNIANYYSSNNGINRNFMQLCDMDAGDTAYITLTGSGGTKTDDLVWSSNVFTFFSSTLIC